MWARFVTEPDEEVRSPEVRIRDSKSLDVTSACGDADARLSEALEHPVALRSLQPAGDFFDAFPLLIVTRSSLAALDAGAAEMGIDSCFDVRRFRPNVLLDVDDEGFVENAWEGRTLRIGGAEVAVKMPCRRCIMTTHGFADLPRDPKVMRTLVRHNGGNLGVYGSVVHGGRVRVGDTARVV